MSKIAIKMSRRKIKHLNPHNALLIRNLNANPTTIWSIKQLSNGFKVTPQNNLITK